MGSNRTGSTVLIISALLLLSLTIWVLWGNGALEENRFIVSSSMIPEAFDGYRIAHVSDLHNAEMGTDNRELLAILEEAEPDMIAITGDLIDSRNTDIAVALRFVQSAMEIAPCYYVTGNHESRIHDYPELKAGLLELGVVVLENASASIGRNGQSITLLGVNDPDFASNSLLQNTLQDLAETAQGFTVLLSHRPELFDIYANCNIGLVLSGHAHGGQFRLPFVGGLYAPHQGFLPEYDAGMYTQDSTCMIVSRGIGNSIFPLRFNNRPEVIIIELKAETGSQ